MAVYYAHDPNDHEQVWEYGDDVLPTFDALQTQVTADGFNVTLVDGLPPDRLAADVRAERDKRLSEDIDKVSSPWWNAMTAQEQSDVSAYRLALLDVPQQTGFPSTISWPNKPSCLS